MPQPKGPRKIEKSEGGRVYWKPGKPHPLDVLYEEVNQVKAQLPGLLEELLSTAQQTTIRLNGMLEAARESNDLTALFSEADRQAHHLIVDRFHNRKHYDHLHAAFTLQRYKRLAGRLKTIQAALNLACDLLGAEETLSQEFLTTWRNSQQEEPQEEEPKEAQPETQLTIEEMRLQGLDEPLTNIVSSVDQSRQFLRNFEAHLPELRRQLSRGQGWIEIFFVPKRHYKPEVIAYAKALSALRKKKTPIPPEVEQAVNSEVIRLIQAGAEKFPLELREEVYDITKVGPYAKYRWVEDGQTYTISLGLIDDYPPYPFVPEGF